MKKRVLAVLLMSAMSVGMLAGCGKKTVDYDIDEESSAADSEVSSESEGGDSLTAYRNQAKWQDEWNTENKYGSDIKVTIDAEIVVPDVDSMRVVVAERGKLDAESKEDFLKSFFAEDEIYFNDEEHQTKADIEGYIAMYEELLAKGEVGDEATEEFAKEQIAKYEGMLAAASDDYTVADNFEDCMQYAGRRDDILYYADFAKTGEWGSRSDINLMYPEDGAPASLLDKGYDKVNCLGREDGDTAEELLNACRFSEEEARELADLYANKLSRTNQVCIEAKPLLWRGENYNEGGTMTGYELCCHGYAFTYGTGVDGIAFREFPFSSSLDTEWKEEEQEHEEDYFGGDELVITVTDLGVTEVSFSDPMVIREISDPVELLPLTTIQGIIEGEVEAYGSRYGFRAGNKFEKLELVYAAVKDKSQEDIYSYIPVWRLERSDGGYPILVNAMDGTVLYSRIHANYGE